MASGSSKMEYRVRWRRPVWKATAVPPSKVFQRVTAAHRFIARLWDKDPATKVSVKVRDVGEWRTPPWWDGERDAGD